MTLLDIFNIPKNYESVNVSKNDVKMNLFLCWESKAIRIYTYIYV